MKKCVPFDGGNDELCDASQLSPYGNSLFVAVDGYTDFSGANLVCTVQGADDDATVTDTPSMTPTMTPTTEGADNDDSTDDTVWLQNGAPWSGISGNVDDTFYFALNTTASTGILDSVSCSTSGGSGDSDIYTNWDNPVDLNDREANTVSVWFRVVSPGC